jgi:hypothetical protein
MTCSVCDAEVNWKPGHEDYMCVGCRRRADGTRKLYECIIIVEIEAFDRDDAENKASDLADCIGDTFTEKTMGATSVGGDHNAYDRLHISMDGHDVG